MRKASKKPGTTLADYRALAEFRYQVQRYLAFSDEAARSAGLLPGQYRLMLMVKGLPEGVEPTIGNLAERLGLRHHSTVELVDRLEERDLIYRERSERHRSFVFLRLTPKGEGIIRKLVVSRKKELQKAGPILVKSLNTLTKKSKK
jgi:DNA-binding MarR family transcriptional regulator